MEVIKGIDASKHQGAIDWTKVKASGAKFVIIRAGYTHYEGGLTVDERFAANMQGAASVGLDIGVYVYSYDKSAAAAKISAQRLLELIKPYKLTYPVAFDMEYEPFNISAGKKVNTDICKAFLEAIESARYYSMLYVSTNFIATYLEESRLNSFDKWIAQYSSKCTYPGAHGIWQYTGSGKCDGIAGDVDWNECYRNYPEVIRKAGLNRLAEHPKDDADAKLQEVLARAERAEGKLAEIRDILK